MRVSRLYGSASDFYRQNNTLNNSKRQVGGGCEFHAYTGAGQTFVGKIIPNPKKSEDASSMRIRERVRRL